MTSSEFFSQKAKFLKKQEPYLILSKEELVAEVDNYYRIGDTSILVSDGAQCQIDELIGLSQCQRKGIKETYGADAITNFRNSIAMANCINKPKRFALVANSQENIVDGVVPLKDQVIPMESFFDLLEMFLDKHSYEVKALESSRNGVYGLTVRLNPIHPQYDAFFGNDEFLTNGYYVKWNLGEMEVGNYYVRLVCANGAVETTHHSLSRINNINDIKINEFMLSPSNSMIIKHNIDRMKKIAHQSSQTMASLSEIKWGQRLLTRHGVPENLAEQLMPYNQLLSQYKEHGFSNHFQQTNTKSNIVMWDLYNNLTEFATHTPLWSDNDNRRSSLMQQSVALLQRKRDIQPYLDIFNIES